MVSVMEITPKVKSRFIMYGDMLTCCPTAAIMRIGLAEMKKFSEHFFEGIKQETWIESCGMADVITSCECGL